jgi:hypothetical protein
MTERTVPVGLYKVMVCMYTSSFAYACMKIKQTVIRRRAVIEITNRFLISFQYEEIYSRLKTFSVVAMNTVFWDVTL